MQYLFLIAAVICLIVGVPNLLPNALYGAAMTVAGILFYLMFRSLNSRGIVDMVLATPRAIFYLYRTPQEVYEAASLLEDHRSGRNLPYGGEVFITDAVWSSVDLQATTLLESSDPSIKVHDLRTHG